MTAIRAPWALPTLLLALAPPLPADAADAPGLVSSEFVYTDDPPTPSCHASTVVEARRGVLAAWFGGTDEGEPDVAIYLARLEGGKWSKPVEGLRRRPGRRPAVPLLEPGPVPPRRRPAPPLRQGRPEPGEVVGRPGDLGRRRPDLVEASEAPRRHPRPDQEQADPTPRTVPCSARRAPRTRPSAGKSSIERTPDLGKTWSKVGPLNDGKEIAAIQPSILTHPGGKLQILCRTRQGKVAEAWSDDLGKTWSPMTLTGLPNPNSGTDALTLLDGRQLLVYNPVAKGRTPWPSQPPTDGKAWRPVLTLEDQPGEYSYPAVIQASDGLVHVTYTWKRARIKHVVVDPKALPKN